MFFRADDKDHPITYQGERTFESLVAFIKQNAKHSITKEIITPKTTLGDAGTGIDHQ